MADGSKYVHDTDIMQEWVELGDRERANSPYVSFMAYWVAFNMEYAPYKRNEIGAEWKAIERYCEQNEERLRRYDPFANGDADAFCGVGLFKLYDWKEEDIKSERDAIEDGDIVALMRAVYKVRNNFFHGNKRLGDPTDRKFVTSGAAIVRGYLGTLGFFPEMR